MDQFVDKSICNALEEFLSKVICMHCVKHKKETSLEQEKSNCQVVVMKMNNSLEVYCTVALGSIHITKHITIKSYNLTLILCALLIGDSYPDYKLR